jgi:hypothetical protein
MVISHTTFSGGVTNVGTIGAGGISVISGAFLSGGGIFDSGIVSGDIKVDASSKIVASGGSILTAIAVENTSTFGGGIRNAGLISAAQEGVLAWDVSTFTGGVTNSGRIAAAGTGIFVGGQALSSSSIEMSSFSGGIANSGTISAVRGIHVELVSTFTGGVSIGGTIRANGPAILIESAGTFSGGIKLGSQATLHGANAVVAADATAFVGGITNAGTISGGADAVLVISDFLGGIRNTGKLAAGGDGVGVIAIALFSDSGAGGGIVDAGTISAHGDGVRVANVAAFSGGITNAGTLSAGAGVGINVTDTASFVNVTLSAFAGGIVNSGRIAAARTGIFFGGRFLTSGSVAISSFSGGISNTGTISAGRAGVFVGGQADSGGSATLAVFAGGITNSKSISAGGDGILVGGQATAPNAFITISTFAGGITNIGTISAGSAGIAVGGIGSVTISTFSGSISNGGTIGAATGIAVFGGGTIIRAIVDGGVIRAIGNGIEVIGGVTLGGVTVSSKGTVSAGASGILVQDTPTFAGGISNKGSISAAGDSFGIGVKSAGAFGGGITNGGAISAGTGIGVEGTTATFAGGISNSGKITGARNGILVQGGSVFGSTSAGGGISNSGVISGKINGVLIDGVTSFAGGIGNSGTISGGDAIFIGNVTSFSGGVSNRGRGKLCSGSKYLHRPAGPDADLPRQSFERGGPAILAAVQRLDPGLHRHGSVRRHRLEYRSDGDKHQRAHHRGNLRGTDPGAGAADGDQPDWNAMLRGWRGQLHARRRHLHRPERGNAGLRRDPVQWGAAAVLVEIRCGNGDVQRSHAGRDEGAGHQRDRDRQAFAHCVRNLCAVDHAGGKPVRPGNCGNDVRHELEHRVFDLHAVAARSFDERCDARALIGHGRSLHAPDLDTSPRELNERH